MGMLRDINYVRSHQNVHQRRGQEREIFIECYKDLPFLSYPKPRDNALQSIEDNPND